MVGWGDPLGSGRGILVVRVEGRSLRRDATRCASHRLINLGGEAGLGTNTTAHIYFLVPPAQPITTHNTHNTKQKGATSRVSPFSRNLLQLDAVYAGSWSRFVRLRI
jgi:hypothetical protein